MTVRRAAVWSLAAQYATFAIQFASSVIISRFFLLPADVGLFSIALAAAMVVSIFQDMGITRFVSGQPDMRDELVRDYAGVAVAISLAVAAGLALAAPLLARFYAEPALTRLMWLIAVSYLISPFATVPVALQIREMKFRTLFQVNAGSALAGNGTAVALASHGFGAASLAWGVLVTAIVRAMIALAVRPVFPRIPQSAKAIRPLLGFSSSSFVISASAAIGQRSQDLIVGRLLGIISTGLFSRASALSGQLSTLVTGAINSVFYPAFARKRDAGESLASPYLHLVACNTALNWAAMVGLALAAEPIVLLLYGDNWASVAPLLRWTAIGEMLFVAVPLQMDIPILLGRIRTLIWVNLIDTFAAVALLASACIWGLEAAAVSRILYGMVWLAIYATFQSHLLGIRLRKLFSIYARSAICALAAGIPLVAASTLGWHGSALGFSGLIMLSGMGVLTWLAALRLTRHPAWAEVSLSCTTLAWPLLSRIFRAVSPASR